MITKKNSIHVIIPAAGIGSRMASDVPKQYLKIGTKAVIEYSIEAFIDIDLVDSVWVGLSSNDSYFTSLDVAANKKVKTYIGGSERADTVALGLECIPMRNAWVLVHDAARPGIQTKLIESLIAQVLKKNHGGLLALPVQDTVKRFHNGRVDTLDRSELWLAQTPQMFQVDLLRHSLDLARRKHIKITDESSAMELTSYDPQIIKGDVANMKLTTPNDLSLIKTFLGW